MSLPLELAPLVFQFLPVKTLKNFLEDDPLLIAVLKIQEGCRPFKVTYHDDGRVIYCRVEHMGFYLRRFSQEILKSLGVVHKIDLRGYISDTFASTLCQNDRADDYHPFPRAEELVISQMHDTISRIDLSLFPKLRSLHADTDNTGVEIYPRSRTRQLSYIALRGGGSTVDGVCDVSINQWVTIEMNKGRDQGFMRLSDAFVDWKPSFDKSWCRSMELYCVKPMDKVATLQGFSNLKILKFLNAEIKLSEKWLPKLPLERMSFWDCYIDGTEIGFWPLVTELDFRRCRMEPLQGHFPRLESLIFHVKIHMPWIGWVSKEIYEGILPEPIAKKNLRKVKSFTLATKSRRIDLSSFKELNHLELWFSSELIRVECLNVDNLEWVTAGSCPIPEEEFPCHVRLFTLQANRTF